MVTINASETLTFPRPYISGVAIFGEDFSARLEGLSIVINNELLNATLRLKINGEVYPARSRSYFLKEFFIASESSYVVEGLPTELTVDVRIGFPDKYTGLSVIVEIAGMVEAFDFIEFPDMPSSYWRPPIA